MSFINAPVDTASLPAAESIELHGVRTAYLKLLRVEWLITSVLLATTTILLLVLVPEARSPQWSVTLMAATLFIVFTYYYLQERSFPYTAYAVREHDVILQRGWLVRSTKICPYTRVQNCSIKSGPLERRWGLASLVLYTAGSEGADIRIPGLLQTDAEELRQFILSRINGTTGV
jgi:membrane protein YdbS with pleckstrin-like domain